MSDDEIVATLKEADAHLVAYHATVTRALPHLAARISAIQNRAYKACLGGYEEGIDTIMLEGDCGEWTEARRDAAYDGTRKSCEFSETWRARLKNAGVRFVNISTLF